MVVERTFSIVKPDGVRRDLVGTIYQRFEAAGLKIVAAKMLQLDEAKAEGFYAEHKGREFYEPLVKFMTSGPIMVQVLEGENAIAKNREIMGKTNFEEAEPGTIRADFASSVRENCVHGSDSPESASREINYFFSPEEICPR